MKIVRLIIAIIFSIFMSSSSIAAKVGASPGNLISMDFQDANLKTVLKLFSQQSGLNFVAGQNIKARTVTIYFDGVTVEDALNHIMSANNLVYEQEPGSNIFIVKESVKPKVETLTKIYELKYAQLAPPPTEAGESKQDAEIVKVIEDILSKDGKVIADKRSNSLIIKEMPSQFAIIEDVLARLDVRTSQVMIEVEIIETTTTVADRLGIQWSGTFGAYAGPALTTRWPLKGALVDKDLITGTGGTMTFASTTATMRAILSDTDSRVLARPKILTLNNETALIELTAQTAVASMTSTTDTGSTSTTSTQAERIDTGITLEVTPQINKGGYITMHIEPTVIVPVLSTYFTTEGSKFVDPQKRSAKTTVMVRDGETIIIGGLISREDSYGKTKIPFLGDLPLIGAAFRYKSKDELDKELLIFITPHVADDSAYKLANISEREQEKPKAVREKEIKTILDLLGEEK
ncbi:MAG: secretin N-terminal domain-containing protein [Candidatus Gorgyraea atricola]|nr:secretin N-terminal domain-containing protein [Candidatus Gorgyraea atricola]